jgi:hypothetical protein
MPVQYTFQPKPFKCELKCQFCNYKNPISNRCCKVKVCVGLPYCRYHMQSAVKLEIKDSEYGKGVFAKADLILANGRRRTPNNNRRQLVFRSGTEIIEYGGEQISKAELDSRYGKFTAPYAIEMGNRKKTYQDGACIRTIGTVINHDTIRQNVEFSQDNKGKRIIITAIKDIYNGDQLYADYGDEYDFEENAVSKTIRTRKRGTIEPSKSECMRRRERTAANKTRRPYK